MDFYYLLPAFALVGVIVANIVLMLLLQLNKELNGKPDEKSPVPPEPIAPPQQNYKGSKLCAAEISERSLRCLFVVEWISHFCAVDMGDFAEVVRYRAGFA
jgi:hypothetical protein